MRQPLIINTGFNGLKETASLDAVKVVVDEVKRHVLTWHRQDEDDIMWCETLDWEGATFACIMKDGTLRFARSDFEENMEGDQVRTFDFIGLPEDTTYTQDDIDMWYMLPWDPRVFTNGVYMDGRLIQKGPQSADPKDGDDNAT